VFGVCTAKYEGGEGDDEEHNRVGGVKLLVWVGLWWW
jgi:hypothetical protein